jgi:hypothetical protein
MSSRHDTSCESLNLTIGSLDLTIGSFNPDSSATGSDLQDTSSISVEDFGTPNPNDLDASSDLTSEENSEREPDESESEYNESESEPDESESECNSPPRKKPSYKVTF